MFVVEVQVSGPSSLRLSGDAPCRDRCGPSGRSPLVTWHTRDLPNLCTFLGTTRRSVDDGHRAHTDGYPVVSGFWGVDSSTRLWTGRGTSARGPGPGGVRPDAGATAGKMHPEPSSSPQHPCSGGPFLGVGAGISPSRDKGLAFRRSRGTAHGRGPEGEAALRDAPTRGLRRGTEGSGRVGPEGFRAGTPGALHRSGDGNWCGAVRMTPPRAPPRACEGWGGRGPSIAGRGS
jgi:hypothetical protein